MASELQLRAQDRLARRARRSQARDTVKGRDRVPGQRQPERGRALCREETIGIERERARGVAHLRAGVVPPFGEGDLAGDHVPREATQRVGPPAGRQVVDHRLSEGAAGRPVATDCCGDGLEQPQACRGALAAALQRHPLRQLADEADEACAIDEHVAPRILHEGARVGAGDAHGDRADRPVDRRFAAGVVEPTRVRRQRPQQVTLAPAGDPLLDRRDAITLALVPIGRCDPQLLQACGAPAPQLGQQGGPHEGVDLVGVGVADAMDEESLRFGLGQEVVRVGSSRQCCGQADMHPRHDGGGGKEIHDLGTPGGEDLPPGVVAHGLICNSRRELVGAGATGSLGQRRQPEAGSPALGPGDDLLGLRRGQIRQQEGQHVT